MSNLRTPWRVAFSLWLALAGLACRSYVPARTPECNAIINHCMEACGNGPDTLSPRQEAMSDGKTTSALPSGCEARCATKC